MERLKNIKENLTPTQMVWLIMTIPMLAIGPLLIRSCNSFSRFRRLERPDHDNCEWSDLWIAIYLVPVFTISKYLFYKAFDGFFRRKHKLKHSGEVLEGKVYKSNRNFFKVFYFFFITCFGMYVYSGTKYHSPTMFGKGNIMYTYSDWPYNQMPDYVKLYYMVGLSYHLEVTIMHFFLPAQNDFFEMLLHHYITILLIVGSYKTAWWNVGINVMIQMDNGDWLGGLIKAFMDFSSTPFVLTNYILLVFSWVYFRIYAYSYEVIWTGSMFGQFITDGNPNQVVYQMLLVGLLLLNIYWTILFLRMGYRFVTKGEVKDIQNPVEDRKPCHRQKTKTN